MTGKLFLIATPIGNLDDITFRAKRILGEVDVVVYEEHREGLRLLAQYKISEKITETLNEHNEEESSSRIIHYLKEGKNVALISDAGTPVFADPGKVLVKMAIEQNIETISIPGPSSFIPALVISGFPINEFIYYGFVSPKGEQRKKELHKLIYEERTMVIMEVPYRLVPLLKDISESLGEDRRICVAFNLTLPDEKIFRGIASELYSYFDQNKIKGEFVIVIEGKCKQKNRKDF
jgi:16S rRNA (cytidine1402-2'-O)-methyltransferase